VVTAAGSAFARAPPALALPDKPSIAVLPFPNMSGDPEQEYFADGMVEEIITALSRIRWLFVIARNSTFTYKGQTIDVKRVGSELGVRYVLEGSVRKAGNRVRITAQLIDALTATHLWADRFDLEDVFDLQDKVAISVAGIIEPTLQTAEIRRSADRPTNDLTAYDLYLRAYAMFFIRKGKSSGKANPRGHPSPRAGDRARAGLWARARPGRCLLPSPRKRRRERRSGDRQSEGRRFRPAGFTSRRRRSGHPRKCSPRARSSRRGHCHHDGADRPCTGA